MNKFFTTLKNIWSIEELRKKILFTLAMLFVYRFGSYVVLPGVIPSALADSSGQGGATDLLGLINIFAGGAFNRASVFALGIMPYITASIIVQLLGFAVPYFQKLQQREGESGRKKLTQITRYLTVAITLVQGGAYLTYIISQGAKSVDVDNTVFWFANIIILATGTMFAMWLGEKITDKGIGNGVSILIMIGIIATLPSAFVFELQSQFDSNGLLIFLLELTILFFVVLATILVIQGVRRIPLQFAKRVVGRASGDLPTAGARDYIPVKLNAAGVMPIIFAQALMFLPLTISQWMSGSEPGTGWFAGLIESLNDFTSVPYNVIYFSLVVIFTYIYTALLVNPQQYSEYLKRQNAFIPGVKPGKATEDYIDSVLSRVTLPGSIFLGLIAILPAIVAAFGVNFGFALFFGGTSLLILVAVVLDTLQQIESYLLMRKYDGLVKSGKIQGRSAMQIGSDL